MEKYTLFRTLTGNKKSCFKYQVADAFGNILAERLSNREYVACTIDGEYFFGRVDLIGKGDHGRSVKYKLSEGENPAPIAYLSSIKQS